MMAVEELGGDAPEETPDPDFKVWWEAVLQGDEAARTDAMIRIKDAVVPMVRKRFPNLDASEIAATIQRTMVRRLNENPDQFKLFSFTHFSRHVRLRAKNRGHEAIRADERDPLSQRVDLGHGQGDAERNDAPQMDPQDMDIVSMEPIDNLIYRELVESFLDFADNLEGAQKTIHQLLAHGTSVDEIVEKLEGGSSARRVRNQVVALRKRFEAVMWNDE